MSRLCFLRQIRPLLLHFPPVGTVAALCESPAVPNLRRHYRVVRLILHLSHSPPVSLGGWSPLLRRWRALLGSWRIPLEACPEIRDSGDPGATSRYRTTECCLPPCQQPRHRNKPVFGAESLRPAFLLCTLRAHQSHGEWQHSLPACSLALAGQDLHPLDSNKKFHHLIFGFLLFQTFPAHKQCRRSQALFERTRACTRRRAPFRSLGLFARFNRGSLLIVGVGNSVRPMHLFGPQSRS